jgi:hypothetical protein
MKHIEIEHHVIIEKVVAEVVDLVSVSFANQVVDILTKPLVAAQFERLCGELSIVSLESTLRKNVQT